MQPAPTLHHAIPHSDKKGWPQLRSKCILCLSFGEVREPGSWILRNHASWLANWAKKFNAPQLRNMNTKKPNRVQEDWWFIPAEKEKFTGLEQINVARAHCSKRHTVGCRCEIAIDGESWNSTAMADASCTWTDGLKLTNTSLQRGFTGEKPIAHPNW